MFDQLNPLDAPYQEMTGMDAKRFLQNWDEQETREAKLFLYKNLMNLLGSGGSIADIDFEGKDGWAFSFESDSYSNNGLTILSNGGSTESTTASVEGEEAIVGIVGEFWGDGYKGFFRYDAIENYVSLGIDKGDGYLSVYKYDIANNEFSVEYEGEKRNYPGDIGFPSVYEKSIDPLRIVSNEFEKTIGQTLGSNWLNVWKSWKEENGAKVGLVRIMNEKGFPKDRTTGKNVMINYTKQINVALFIGPMQINLGLFNVRAAAISIYLGKCLKNCPK